MGGDETAQPVPLRQGSGHERAIRTQRVVVEDESGPVRLFAPVTNRGEAIGLIELLLAERPDDRMIHRATSIAHAFRAGDHRETPAIPTCSPGAGGPPRCRWRPRFSIGCCPAFICEAGQFTLAGWGGPAGEVAGDTFDYSLERTVLHL